MTAITATARKFATGKVPINVDVGHLTYFAGLVLAGLR